MHIHMNGNNYSKHESSLNDNKQAWHMSNSETFKWEKLPFGDRRISALESRLNDATCHDGA